MFKNILAVNEKEKDLYYKKFRDRLREYVKEDHNDNLLAEWKIMECSIELEEIEEEEEFILKVLKEF